MRVRSFSTLSRARASAAVARRAMRGGKGCLVISMLLIRISSAHAAPCPGAMFEPPRQYAMIAGTVVVLADLDGDQRPEILTSGNHVRQFDAFSMLVNRGDGTFDAEREIATGFGDRLEDVADWNGDGVPDLVAANYWANGIALTPAVGTFEFGPRVPRDTATHGGPTRIVDYDFDGVPDVVSFSFGSANPVRVHLFRGRGDGTFEERRTIETPLTVAASPSVRIRDGGVEILTGNHSGQLAVFRIAGGTVSWSVLSAGPGSDTSQVFADVNRDGVEDIIHTTDGDGAPENPYEWIFVTLGRADGSFGERLQLQHPRQIAFPRDVRVADLDRDGLQDLVVSDFGTPTLHVFRGDGTGNFNAGVAIDAGGTVTDFAIADLNGDARPDLVTASDAGTVSVHENRRCGTQRRRTVRH